MMLQENYMMPLGPQAYQMKISRWGHFHTKYDGDQKESPHNKFFVAGNSCLNLRAETPLITLTRLVFGAALKRR
jgi:hypothetical protein